LSEGVALTVVATENTSSSSVASTVPTITYLFECADGCELPEDEVVQALLKLRTIKMQQLEELGSLTKKLSSVSPVSAEHLVDATVVSEHTGKLLYYRQEVLSLTLTHTHAHTHGEREREKYDRAKAIHDISGVDCGGGGGVVHAYQISDFQVLSESASVSVQNVAKFQGLAKSHWSVALWHNVLPIDVLVQ
jgi:hypothetical protein